MARSNSSEPRAGSGNGADAGVAGDSATGRSDWQLAKRLIKAQIRYPKSWISVLWSPVFMLMMLMSQTFERGEFSRWFFSLCVVLIAGLSPNSVAWNVEFLRAMSCATAVIQKSRLVLMLGYGLIVLSLLVIALGVKLGPSYYEFWLLIALSVILQIVVHTQAWREAAKIGDAGTREERIKNAKLEKSATKKLRTSADQVDKTVIGTQSRFGQVLSSGDLLLDDLILQPYLNGLKWFAPLIILGAYGVIFFSELVKPVADGEGGWGLFIVVMFVLNCPLGLADGYHHQVLHWLAMSGSRLQWWRQHVKQVVSSLWLGPIVILVIAMAHTSAMMVRGKEPLYAFTGKSTLVLVLVGLSLQLLLMGLATTVLVVVNKLRGWIAAVVVFGFYISVGTSFGVALALAVKSAGGLSALMNANSDKEVGEQLWHMGWGAIVSFLAVAAVVWAFNAWRYRRIDIRDSGDLNFTGTSK